MSWDINRVVLVGRLSSDVDLRYTQSGTPVSKFGLAVGGKPKPDGSDTVSFFNIVVWGKMGENCSTYLHKGDQISVDGRLEQRSWTAQDGAKRSTVEITAERVEFLKTKRADGGTGSEAVHPAGLNDGQGVDTGYNAEAANELYKDAIPTENETNF